VSRRSDSYPGEGYGVRWPEPIWTAGLDEMRRYATQGVGWRRRGSEALVYVGGVVAGGEIVVTTLYCLGHEAQGDCVIVTADEARWLLRMLRERDEKLVGQVHSHRFAAGHSPGDDQHATSFHEGFLSIVVPRFGQGVTSVEQCAVLAYRRGAFEYLGDDEVAERLRVQPQAIARVATAPIVSSTDTPESRWPRFVQSLKSIARTPH
jgi:hypothetical protein